MGPQDSFQSSRKVLKQLLYTDCIVEKLYINLLSISTLNAINPSFIMCIALLSKLFTFLELFYKQLQVGGD